MSIKTFNVSNGDVSVSDHPAPATDTINDIADRVRVQRNALLAASDWTQIPDAPVDKSAWAAYRQALRDIPQQSGFPNSVTWPSKPE